MEAQTSVTLPTRHGQVYRLPNGLAAKVPNPGMRRKVMNDSHINKMLFDDGFPVPRPYGFQNIEIDGVDAKEAFVREFVDGVPLSDIHDFGLISSYFDKYESLLDILRERGYMPDDTTLSNCIVTPEGNVMLIDFADWTYIGGGK